VRRGRRIAGPGETLDTAWGYESYVPRALDALERRDQPPDARDWLRGAVVFVAGLFARGPEFQEEFAERLPASLRQESPRLGSPDHATGARVVDLQVLLAPILAARWAVVHFADDEDLVVSDRGYTLRMTPGGGLLRYAIPVSRQAALVLTPRDRGTPLLWSGSSWVVEVEHFDADPGDAAALNQATGAFARQAVFGSSQHGVEQAGADLGKADRLTAGLFEVLDPASHLYDYFRVLIAIAEPPGADRSLNDEGDWKKGLARVLAGTDRCRVALPGPHPGRRPRRRGSDHHRPHLRNRARPHPKTDRRLPHGSAHSRRA
jgi:hypothetical protein